MTTGVKPVEAAGLVLIRGPDHDDAEATEVLLGRRHAGARFMPGVYVYPGGRTCPADRKPSGFDETLAPSPPDLDHATRRRLPILSRAALRETFEETGLLVVRPGVPPGTAAQSPMARPEPWAAYARLDLVPAFDRLRLIGRAITPAGSPIRFDTRFFLADGAQTWGTIRGDGELEDLGWVSAAETMDLPMASITRRVLKEVLDRRAVPSGLGRPAILFRQP